MPGQASCRMAQQTPGSSRQHTQTQESSGVPAATASYAVLSIMPRTRTARCHASNRCGYRKHHTHPHEHTVFALPSQYPHLSIRLELSALHTPRTCPNEKSSVMLQSTPCLCSFLQASTPSQVEASLMYSRSGPMPREPYRSTRRIACGEGEGQGVKRKQGLSVCGAQGVGHTVSIKHKCLGGGMTAVDVEPLRTYAMGAVQVNKVHCLQSSEEPRSGTNAGVKRAMQHVPGWGQGQP